MAHPTHETESSDSDEHFSDAHSGLGNSGSTTPVRPLTQVEKNAPEQSSSEDPGAKVYNSQNGNEGLAERAVIPEPRHLGIGAGGIESSEGPDPTTGVEKQKQDTTPSHQTETPGTVADQQRPEDTVPGTVGGDSKGDSSSGVVTPIPKIESSERTDELDLTEEAKDAPGSPTSRGVKSIVTRSRRTSSGASRRSMKEKPSDGVEEDVGFGDDFDDFEEGEEDAEFDDFDDGFQEAGPPVQAQPTPAFAYPVLNFSTISSPSALFAATEPYLDTLFPPSSLPSPPSSTTSTTPSSSAPTFLTSRSASLWSQLVAPPPLQPPNWIRSRIRRLFLISLGVPIDLDEILPASKQKKLILPSTPISPRTSTSLSRLKSTDANASSTSVDSQGVNNSSRSSRKKASHPALGLDLLSARQLCNVTDEARAGFTDEELRNHLKRLEALKGAANEALEYWVKKTDETIGDREAFEGVIENLVKHARKVRK